jgi:hypothetical protein
MHTIIYVAHAHVTHHRSYTRQVDDPVIALMFAVPRHESKYKKQVVIDLLRDDKTVDYGGCCMLLQLQVDYYSYRYVVHDPSNTKNPFFFSGIVVEPVYYAARATYLIQQQQHQRQGGVRRPLPVTKDGGKRAQNINTLRHKE